jgi:small conductance mechanosensitive channel
MGEELLKLWQKHSGAILLLARNIVASAVVIVICVIISQGTKKLINKAKTSSLQAGGLAAHLLQGIVRYGVMIIGIIMILNIFGVNTSSLLAVLGAAGVAIGLALKDTLGNIASGIIIMVLGSYRKGEYIEFNSYAGTVKEINMFTTVLETPDGICISAPNSSIWGSPLKNYTRNGKRRMELSIGIAYSDSVDTAFQVLRGIIDAETRFLKEPLPQVILQEIQDNSVKISIRAWASIDDYWNIYWDTIKAIKEKIEAAGLHIPFPQCDVHLIEDARGTGGLLGNSST